MIFIIIGSILIAGYESMVYEALGVVSIILGATILCHKQLTKKQEKEGIE